MLLTHAALLGILAFAVWIDVRTRRIPNVLLVVGLALAMIVGGWESGWASIGERLAAASVGLMLLVPLFLMRVIGAGDVKLMAVVGAYVGMSAVWPVALYTFLAGGVVGAVGLAYARMTSAASMARMRAAVLAGVARLRGVPTSIDVQTAFDSVRVPYSIAIAAGVFFWLLVNK